VKQRTVSGPEGLRLSLATVTSEITSALARIDPGRAEEFARTILQAKRVYVTGAGRSGLIGSCFAMRLVHLGLTAHVVGEVTAPGVSRGDLLVVSSGSGKTSTTVAQATAARSRGAKVGVVTASDRSPIARLADIAVVIPCAPFARAADKRRGAAVESLQFGGSLFEQSLLVFYDALTLELARRLDRSPTDMQFRHSNLE